jgi:hypothetical protein
MGACLIHEGVGMLSWILQPEYTIKQSSEDLARRIPSNAVVTGQFAIQLTFDTELRAVPVWGGYYNSDRPFERYGISHLVLWDYNDKMEIRNFEEHFPEAMARARPLFLRACAPSSGGPTEMPTTPTGYADGTRLVPPARSTV